MKSLVLLLVLVYLCRSEMQIVKSDDYLNITTGDQTLKYDIYGFYDYPFVSSFKLVWENDWIDRS